MAARIGVTFRSPEKAEPYLRALREFGVECVALTPGQPYEVEELGGLLVTGGGADIDPALYGQQPHPKTDGPPDVERDRMEADLIRKTLAAGTPLLCICRGMQMLNIVAGGTLNQHIPQCDTHRVKPPAGRRHEPVHEITVAAGTRLREIVGAGTLGVNSRHHQAVDRVGEGLVVSARAPDGVIEALERPGQRFVLACQWHPEESVRTSAGDQRIFEAFVEQSG